MPNFKKIVSTEIKEGMRFTMPVFFDDGQNMFLAKRKSVKKYHLNAIKQWNLKFFLTCGEVITEEEFLKQTTFSELSSGDFDELIEEVEELEELDDLEEVI